MMHANRGINHTGPTRAAKELKELREQVAQLTKLVEKLAAQNSTN